MKDSGILTDLPSKVKASEAVLRVLGSEASQYMDSNGNIDVSKLPLHLKKALESASEYDLALQEQFSAEKGIERS